MCRRLWCMSILYHRSGRLRCTLRLVSLMPRFCNMITNLKSILPIVILFISNHNILVNLVLLDLNFTAREGLVSNKLNNARDQPCYVFYLYSQCHICSSAISSLYSVSTSISILFDRSTVCGDSARCHKYILLK